ncbi:MAG: response regulator [Hyphomonadaceae bacterium]|nr:response regulator [Hyphomonadaceae bacterium]
MGLAEQFGPHIPYLRRYARALTGSQEIGDTHVRAALSSLAQDPARIDLALPSRVALYRFFHDVSIRPAAMSGNDASSVPTIHDQRLQALADEPRQAFLLTAMEGFSCADTALILGYNTADVEALVAQALREIETGLKTKVLIVEDEPIIAADLESLVSELGHTVTGNAITHTEAVAMARKSPPGLILCDIQLADNSSGIDAANDILAEFNVPVIFITAFPERLLTGERPEPAYLISKPFQENTVKAAIGQALFFHPVAV